PIPTCAAQGSCRRRGCFISFGVRRFLRRFYCLALLECGDSFAAFTRLPRLREAPRGKGKEEKRRRNRRTPKEPKHRSPLTPPAGESCCGRRPAPGRPPSPR